MQPLTFCPYKADFIVHPLVKRLGQNPITFGVLYFAVVYVGMYAIGFATGTLFGTPDVAPMYSDVLMNINFGIISPIGAALLINLYNKISHAFESLIDSGMIESQEEYIQFVRGKLYSLYNNPYISRIAISVALVINTINHITDTASFIGINGGLTGLYCRAFLVLNDYIIMVVVCKVMISLYGIHTTFSRFKPAVKIIHHDKSGGLAPLGELTLSQSYFVMVIMLNMALLALFNHSTTTFTLTYLTFFVCCVLSLILLVWPNRRAHLLLEEHKREAEEKLHNSYRSIYRSHSWNDRTLISPQVIQQLKHLEDVHRLIKDMSIWPFNQKILFKYIVSIGFPLSLSLVDLVLRYNNVIPLEVLRQLIQDIQ